MRKHSISSDALANEALREEVQTLRGGIVEQAEKAPLPNRFHAEPHPDRPAFTITDVVTGRSTTVPIFAYRNVRESLTDLFGPTFRVVWQNKDGEHRESLHETRESAVEMKNMLDALDLPVEAKIEGVTE